MAAKITEEKALERRILILEAARWCFLNFGFAKTSLDDIAKRANISRTLLYKTFKNKEDIFTAVFEHWLISRHPKAIQSASEQGSPYERLLNVCQVMAIEPYIDMAGAPMASEFYDVCERMDPEISENHRLVALQCFVTILEDEAAGEVFLLALDGLLADEPTSETLEQRVKLLADRFTHSLFQQEMARIAL